MRRIGWNLEKLYVNLMCMCDIVMNDKSVD